MAKPVIFELPQEVLHYILEFMIKEGDNDAVLVANTSRRWYDIVTERRGGNTRYDLSIRRFVKTMALFFWTRENGYFKLDFHTYVTAAREGCLGVVQWIRERKSRGGDEFALAAAIAGGHIDIVKWLRSEGCVWSINSASNAVQYGHFELLKWMHQDGCYTSRRCGDYAARIGRLDILDWLVQRGCCYDQWTMLYAVEHGHLDIVKWLRGRDCRWGKEYCYDTAVSKGYNEMAEWIASQPD